MCSLCKKVLTFGARWIEVEDAIRDLDLFDSARLPELDYVVCDHCTRPQRRRDSGSAAA